jgi:hypothetical protein
VQLKPAACVLDESGSFSVRATACSSASECVVTNYFFTPTADLPAFTHDDFMYACPADVLHRRLIAGDKKRGGAPMCATGGKRPRSARESAAP